ncbi:hypothetical protein B0T20DRAFT_56400 [Sordaria brevicollis]|uniref:Uncharacterized protein n=1 Tax=Sordaria brevicollis TaxID=83679 RepID=A0AAE0P3D4_SORBR|nr:hypothetical protein B0T20DRAFT_56400 [Sordaria brevicollis]
MVENMVCLFLLSGHRPPVTFRFLTALKLALVLASGNGTAFSYGFPNLTELFPQATQKRQLVNERKRFVLGAFGFGGCCLLSLSFVVIIRYGCTLGRQRRVGKDCGADAKKGFKTKQH